LKTELDNVKKNAFKKKPAEGEMGDRAAGGF